jgi:small-conductance mechanosensitive channel
MILTVTEFGRERKSIASSMHDVDQAINVLDRLLAVVVFIIVVLVFVAFLNKGFGSTLATTGTALLSLSFVFSVSAQEVLGSCIFLFVKHPYDIGDRVDIGTAGCLNQEQFVVEHISLLFTVFRHVQGTAVGRMCQIPNIVLNTLWVRNPAGKTVLEPPGRLHLRETSEIEASTILTELFRSCDSARDMACRSPGGLVSFSNQPVS